MHVPWEIFATVFAALVALIVYTWRDMVSRIEKINGSVVEAKDELSNHKLWAADNYIKKSDCKDLRANCPVKPAAKEAT